MFLWVYTLYPLSWGVSKVLSPDCYCRHLIAIDREIIGQPAIECINVNEIKMTNFCSRTHMLLEK